MPKRLTMRDVADIATTYAVRTGDFSRFEAWIVNLERRVDDADFRLRNVERLYGAHQRAKMTRQLRAARLDLKLMDDAQISARTEYNKLLLRGSC
jgi:hypothetical protein